MYKEQGHFGAGMALSPDGKMLAYGWCGGRDPNNSVCVQYEITLWDVATRQPIGQPLKFSIGGATTPEELFSPDGKTLAVMSSGTTGSGIIQLFDVTTRQPTNSPLGGEEQFASMAFSPDGKFMALGNIVGVIYIWDVKSHQVFSHLMGEKGFVTSVAFSPDGKTLVSRILIPSTDLPPKGKIVLWDLNTQQPIGQPLIAHTATGSEVGLTNMALSPDGKTLASIDDNGAIALWDVTTRQPIGQAFIGQSATGGVGVTISVAFSPDGRTLVSGTEDGTITLWELAASFHSP
jgi:WD40 repeat protein